MSLEVASTGAYQPLMVPVTCVPFPRSSPVRRSSLAPVARAFIDERRHSILEFRDRAGPRGIWWDFAAEIIGLRTARARDAVCERKLEIGRRRRVSTANSGNRGRLREGRSLVGERLLVGS